MRASLKGLKAGGGGVGEFDENDGMFILCSALGDVYLRERRESLVRKDMVSERLRLTRKYSPNKHRYLRT